MKRLFCFLLIAMALPGQMAIITIADITGDASKHAISATSKMAKWVQIAAITGNSAAVRIGDSNVGTARGTPIAAGTGLMLPMSSDRLVKYDLSKIYYYAGTGDKLSVTYAQ